MNTDLNLEELIAKSGVHRLIICSELKISLAMLDDFIYNRVKMPEKLYQKLISLINKENQ